MADIITLEGEECVIVYNMGNWTKTLCYGPFDDDEEARTFIACGPHGLEDYSILARVVPLYPPHTVHVDLNNGTALLDASQ